MIVQTIVSHLGTFKISDPFEVISYTLNDDIVSLKNSTLKINGEHYLSENDRFFFTLQFNNRRFTFLCAVSGGIKFDKGNTVISFVFNLNVFKGQIDMWKSQNFDNISSDFTLTYKQMFELIDYRDYVVFEKTTDLINIDHNFRIQKFDEVSRVDRRKGLAQLTMSINRSLSGIDNILDNILFTTSRRSQPLELYVILENVKDIKISYGRDSFRKLIFTESYNTEGKPTEADRGYYLEDNGSVTYYSNANFPANLVGEVVRKTASKTSMQNGAEMQRKAESEFDTQLYDVGINFSTTLDSEFTKRLLDFDLNPFETLGAKIKVIYRDKKLTDSRLTYISLNNNGKIDIQLGNQRRKLTEQLQKIKEDQK